MLFAVEARRRHDELTSTGPRGCEVIKGVGIKIGVRMFTIPSGGIEEGWDNERVERWDVDGDVRNVEDGNF